MVDLAAARTAALGGRRAAARGGGQTDRYYALEGGRRVKLRTIAGGRAEMIEYRRAEASGVRASDYTVRPVRDAAAVRPGSAGPPLVVVRKRREMLLWDNVRIHLDGVDRLGTFLELGAVVDEAHDEACCRGR